MMKRNRRCNPQKQRYWEEAVRRWKESGRSVRDYCRTEGLRESAFFFWRRKLSQCSQSSDAVGQPASKGSQVTPAPRAPKRPQRGTPSFLPVRVVGPASGGAPVQRVATTVEATRGVEIVLAHGRSVRVQAGFDRQTLVDVLALLEVQPC
jgi:transposase-like protein